MEVSNKVIPRLKACVMTAMPASSSSGELYAPVSPMHPNPSLDTYMDGINRPSRFNQALGKRTTRERRRGRNRIIRGEVRP